MTPKKKCPIFCLDDKTDIDDFSKMIDWAFENKDVQTVLMLDESEVLYYQNKGLWQIIAEQTGSFLFGLHEDDWILDSEVIKNIAIAIKQSNLDKDRVVDKLLFILDYAITHNKSVVFYL